MCSSLNLNLEARRRRRYHLVFKQGLFYGLLRSCPFPAARPATACPTPGLAVGYITACTLR